MSIQVFNPLSGQFDLTSTGGAPPVGSVNEIDGNSGQAFPSTGVIDVVGLGVTSSGLSASGNIITVSSGSTVTIYETQAQEVTNYTPISVLDSPYTAVLSDYYISVDATGGVVTVFLPDAPLTRRMFLVKDKLGQSSMNFITVTTTGGATLFDGSTTYILDTDYEAVLFTYNGTSYEAF